MAQGEIGIASRKPAPDKDHGRAGGSGQQDESRHIAVQLLGREPGRKEPADEKPGQQRHREGLDRPVDEEGDANALPVRPHLMQGAEVDLHQHGDDHHPDEQPDGDVNLGDLQPPKKLEGRRNPLAEPDAGQDTERHPESQPTLEDTHGRPCGLLDRDLALHGHRATHPWSG